MRTRHLAIVTVLCTSLLLLLVGGADAAPQARKVFLNGVNLEGVELPEAVFKGCTVKLDKHGNIHISAPGVQLEAEKGGKDAKHPAHPPRTNNKAPARLTQRYFLVTKGKRAKATQYKVTVYINGKRFTTLHSSTAPSAVEITDQLRPGHNRIELLAKKLTQKAGSSRDVFEIQIAEGDVEKGKAVIRDTVMTYRRTGAEVAAFRDQYRLTTR